MNTDTDTDTNTNTSKIEDIVNKKQNRDIYNIVSCVPVEDRVLGIDIFTDKGEHLDYAKLVSRVIALDIFSPESYPTIQKNRFNIVPIRLPFDSVTRYFISGIFFDIVNINKSNIDLQGIHYAVQAWKDFTKYIIVPQEYTNPMIGFSLIKESSIKLYKNIKRSLV